MKVMIHVGLDVHNDSIAISIAKGKRGSARASRAVFRALAEYMKTSK